ncbi:MAG: chorismate mutase [Acetobacteraceae bacterium]|nr:chorismate mutase [Acetobacteraceae bacterium]
MADDPPAPDRWQQDLAELRGELDQIDDSLHDLLIRRAEIVQQVGMVKPDRGLAFRPGRQAAILRRLLARHHGALPPQAIVGIWGELLSATTAMQTSFTVAVCESDPACGFSQITREQFGALVPMHIHRDPAQALADVRSGRTVVAVLPFPSDTGALIQHWWTALLPQDEPLVHVVARIPFWSLRPEGVPAVQALVVSAIAPDPSGDDRTLLGLECDPGTSPSRILALLAATGLGSGSLLMRCDSGDPVARALVEIPGFLAEDDSRLADIGARVLSHAVLGAYAVPVGGGA